MRLTILLIGIALAIGLAAPAAADCGCAKHESDVCGCAHKSGCQKDCGCKDKCGHKDKCGGKEACGCNKCVHKPRCGGDVKLLPDAPQEGPWIIDADNCCPRAEYTLCLERGEFRLLCHECAPKKCDCEEPKASCECEKCKHKKHCGCGSGS